MSQTRPTAAPSSERTTPRDSPVAPPVGASHSCGGRATRLLAAFAWRSRLPPTSRGSSPAPTAIVRAGRGSPTFRVASSSRSFRAPTRGRGNWCWGSAMSRNASDRCRSVFGSRTVASSWWALPAPASRRRCARSRHRRPPLSSSRRIPRGRGTAIAQLVDAPPPRRSVVVIDDLDALAARFPHEYAAELTQRLERFVRGAGDHGILVLAAAQRLTGSAARIAELLPRRVLLSAATRAEYMALGGEGAHHAPRSASWSCAAGGSRPAGGCDPAGRRAGIGGGATLVPCRRV